MRLPKIAIENYQFVVVLIFMILSTGLISFFNMPRSEDPQLKFPGYTVLTVYPGTSPKDMEELIVDPLENAIKEVEDITDVNTRIEDGVAVIQIDAEFDVDVDDKYDEIVAQVSSVEQELPAGILALEVTKISPQEVKILQLAFVSPRASYSELQRQAEKLEDRFDQVQGVRDVEIEAYPEQEVRIALDLQKMAQLGIPIKQVMGTLQANHNNIPAGELDAGDYSFAIKTSGGYEAPRQLSNTVIGGGQGNIIHLRDVARVYMAYQDEQYLGRYQGDKAVFLSITQKAGENILQVNERVMATVAAFKEELPAHINMETVFAQAPAVESRINDFFGNLLQGIALVGLVIFLFLGFRNALIVSTVIPTSIIAAIYMLDLSGFALQQISIAGLVIALGLLVDNGIVVIENINRYLSEGAGLKEAAIKGTSEVGWALVSATATTVLSFFPMTQLGGGTGEFIQSLPLIVIFSLLASLVLALGFTPLLASKWLKPASPNASLTRIEKGMKSLIEKGYRPALQFSLRRPWLVLALALGSLVGSGALFPLVGVSFFPAADKPIVMVDIFTTQGSNLETTDEAAHWVESMLDTMPLVADYTTNVGHGNPRIYYNVIPERYNLRHAQLLVNLNEWDRKKMNAFLAELRQAFKAYPGARITVDEFKNGPPYAAPIEIKILGPETKVLTDLAAELEDVIALNPGTDNVDNPLRIPKTDLKVAVNRDKAGMLGVQLADIDLAVRTALTGTKIGTMSQENGEEYDMVLRMPVAKGKEISAFDRVYVPAVTGAQVPLRQLASLHFEPGPAKMNHYNFQRTAVVTADVVEGFNTTEVTLALIEALAEIELPKGYSFYIGGEYETQQDSFGDLGQMLIVALLGIFAVLILQFRSFMQPFIVFSAIPLAFGGSILALFLSGYSFSFMAFVGFTSLVGIVVNTSIILVDYTNQLRRQGMALREAIQKASETRFTPILLTTLTTIFGLLPLTLTNSALWSPLGWTIIGGMISSTVLSLLMVPVLYQWLSPKLA
ncbi:MAG: efflux RND transporter permease subunit [Bacteroidota bacterium]